MTKKTVRNPTWQITDIQTKADDVMRRVSFDAPNTASSILPFAWPRQMMFATDAAAANMLTVMAHPNAMPELLGERPLRQIFDEVMRTSIMAQPITAQATASSEADAIDVFLTEDFAWM